jgi:pantoate--beta-alanine ligase
VPPDLIRAIPQVRLRLDNLRRGGQSIGIVPTMGALHAGHAALMDRARAETECVVVTIFVNPIQFDRREDYEAYAVHLEQDLALCERHGVDLVFAPTPEEMYPRPQAAFVEVQGLQDRLCGPFRPGHFRGVATVVAKLFGILGPGKAYFGEKDAQQLAVVQRMVLDLNTPVEIVPVPTVREPDGLALSSRNRRLTPEERLVAPLVYQALQLASDAIRQGSGPAEARETGLHLLRSDDRMRVEYFDVVDAATLQPVEQMAGPVRIAAAVWLGRTRLIDNLLCEWPPPLEHAPAGML